MFTKSNIGHIGNTLYQENPTKSKKQIIKIHKAYKFKHNRFKFVTIWLRSQSSVKDSNFTLIYKKDRSKKKKIRFKRKEPRSETPPEREGYSLFTRFRLSTIATFAAASTISINGKPIVAPSPSPRSPPADSTPLQASPDDPNYSPPPPIHPSMAGLSVSLVQF